MIMRCLTCNSECMLNIKGAAILKTIYRLRHRKCEQAASMANIKSYFESTEATSNDL